MRDDSENCVGRKVDCEKSSRFVPPNLPSFADLRRTADENLFDQVVTDKKHVLHGLLPPPSVASQNYNLRNRKCNLEPPPTPVSDETVISYNECYT